MNLLSRTVADLWGDIPDYIAIDMANQLRQEIDNEILNTLSELASPLHREQWVEMTDEDGYLHRIGA